MEKSKLMRLKDIAEEYEIKKTTMWKISRSPNFPKPLDFGEGLSKLYRRKEIEHFFGC